MISECLNLMFVVLCFEDYFIVWVLLFFCRKTFFEEILLLFEKFIYFDFETPPSFQMMLFLLNLLVFIFPMNSLMIFGRLLRFTNILRWCFKKIFQIIFFCKMFLLKLLHFISETIREFLLFWFQQFNICIELL